MHNKGLFDEFGNVAIDVDPAVNELVTLKGRGSGEVTRERRVSI